MQVFVVYNIYIYERNELDIMVFRNVTPAHSQ